MELTLNELKIFRNALNKKLRDAHILSIEYSDIKKSLYKVNTEIERIEKDIIKKTYDEAFRAVRDKLKPKNMKDFLKNSKITDSKIELIEPNYEGIAKVLSE